MFLLGVLSRKIRFVEANDGAFLLKFMFFITLPVMIFLKMLDIELDVKTIFYPLAGILTSLGCMLLAFLVLRFVRLGRQDQGTVIISSMIINVGYMYPFILAIYGDEGFVYAVLLDFGNTLMTTTVIYVLAFRYGKEQHTHIALLSKPLKLPLIWSILLAVTLNLLAVPIPEVIKHTLQPIGNMTIPLILIALGILTSARLHHLKHVVLVLFIRMGLGLVIGVLLATAFHLQGTAFIVVSLCAGAPVGFNAATYSVLAKLDVDLASSIVSASILAGLIYIPLLMHLLPMVAG
jgi:hypothetical protein